MILFRRLVAGSVAAALAGAATLACASAVVAAPVWYENGLKPTAGRHVSVTAFGRMQFQSEEQGPINCNNVFGASIDNESERGTLVPRGSFEGWGTNQCNAETLELTLKELGLPTTVYASPELPLEELLVEGEICNSAAYREGYRQLTQCPAHNERESRILTDTYLLKRDVTSFPWKTQLTERTEPSGERVTADTIGIGAGGASCYPLVQANQEGVPTELAANWPAVPAGCIKVDVIAPAIPDEIEFYGSLSPIVRNGAGSGVNPTRLEFTANTGKLVCAECEVRDPETPVNGLLKVMGAENQALILAKGG